MKTKFLTVKDGTLAYDDTGSGALVVCVPSMGDLRSEYRFLAPRLVADGWRVVTLDVRGHGETSVRWPDYTVAGIGQDILDLIADLDAGPAVVIGTSMAAGSAIWAATERPDLITGLVLIGPAVHGEVTGFNRLLYSLLFSRPWGPAVWVKYISTLFPTHKPDDFVDRSHALQANLNEAGRMAALRSMILAPKTASEERLSLLKKPAQIIMGSRDGDFKDPQAEAEWLTGILDAPYTLVDQSGHYPHVEMPAETAAVILDFLKTLEGAMEKSHVA